VTIIGTQRFTGQTAQTIASKHWTVY